MPLISFAELPASGRVWLFGASADIDEVDEQRVLYATDEFLRAWHAHGVPLWAAREWRDGRFLAVGVDVERAGASGCSIDGLFRSLRGIESAIGTTMLNSSLVFYRDTKGFVHSVSRPEFCQLARTGHVGPDTLVMDLSITEVATYRSSFERRASESWHASLL